MLMTVICILAVDFKVFPREFAKAETWGTSLVSFGGDRLRCGRLIDSCQMDLGVGSFVFSLGLISALPLLKSTARAPFLYAVWVSTKKSAGVLALGVVRVVMVKGIEYPVRGLKLALAGQQADPIPLILKEHVSEYGVHWNFFFTLGLLPIFGAAFQDLSPHFSFTGMALVVTHRSLILLESRRRLLTAASTSPSAAAQSHISSGLGSERCSDDAVVAEQGRDR